MSTDPISEEHYEIDPAGDLTVKVFEYDWSITNGHGGHPVKRIALMRVSREVLVNNSDHAESMLGPNYKEASGKDVQIHEDTVESIRLWYSVLHGNINDDLYAIDRVEIFNAMAAAKKYFIHLEKLEDWFATYWSRLDLKSLELDDLKELLCPAQAFDHPKAFAWLTLTMAYTGSGHIEEHNPSRHRELHVEGRVIQQLNAAKGSMRKEIIKGLFGPLDIFCSNNCTMKEKSLWAYIQAVRNTKIWPLEIQHTRSNKEIIDSPGFVHWQCEIPEGACTSCVEKLRGGHVKKTRENILKYWHGLCLDCMNITTPKTGDLDTDYWQHGEEDDDYDAFCRIHHLRNTWYFSFMGRPEYMSSFQREQKERRNAARRRHSFGSGF